MCDKVCPINPRCNDCKRNCENRRALKRAEQVSALSDSELKCLNYCPPLKKSCVKRCLKREKKIAAAAATATNTVAADRAGGRGCRNVCPPGKMCPAICLPAFESEELADTMNAASTAANWARSQVGSCYSQDANKRMSSCFDCSSLVYRAYKAAGIDIGATYTGAFPGRMREVSTSNLQVGDVLWKPGHVGIYLGNNEVVNAENPRTGVQVRSLDYYRKYMGFTKAFRI